MANDLRGKLIFLFRHENLAAFGEISRFEAKTCYQCELCRFSEKYLGWARGEARSFPCCLTRECIEVSQCRPPEAEFKGVMPFSVTIIFCDSIEGVT